MERVGVVTVTYNSTSVLEGFLNSLFRQSYNGFLLFVIDNSSSDSTVEKLKVQTDVRIRLIANSRNVGFAEATNQGIAAAIEAGCELILLMNNDTEFDDQALAKLVGGLYKHNCDMVAPKILFHDNPKLIWSAGGGLNRWKGYSGFHYGYGEVDRGQFDEPRLVVHAPACCLLLRKEVFERIGKLDGRYFTYVEDTDFSYRARRAGLRVMYLPSVTVLHKAHSLTGGLYSDFMMRFTTRNRVYFMLKHFGALRGLYFLLAYQLHLFLQLLGRKTRPSMFWLREKAFVEGLVAWRRSLAD